MCFGTSTLFFDAYDYHRRRLLPTHHCVNWKGPQSRRRLRLWDEHARTYREDGANIFFYHLRRLYAGSDGCWGVMWTAQLSSCHGARFFPRIDYCNAVLSGTQFLTLLPVLSVAFAHETTSITESTGYLPVAACIEFKLCLLVYQALNGLAPSYTTDMLQHVTTLDHQVTLRSVDNNITTYLFPQSSPSRWKCFSYCSSLSVEQFVIWREESRYCKKRSKKTKDLKSCSANITATFNYFYRFIFLCYKQHGRLM